MRVASHQRLFSKVTGTCTRRVLAQRVRKVGILAAPSAVSCGVQPKQAATTQHTANARIGRSPRCRVVLLRHGCEGCALQQSSTRSRAPRLAPHHPLLRHLLSPVRPRDTAAPFICVASLAPSRESAVTRCCEFPSAGRAPSTLQQLAVPNIKECFGDKQL